MIGKAKLFLEGIAALLVTGLVLVTCVDVVGRYAFNAPLSGAFELTQVCLAALVFVALPLTTLHGGHVEVDLLLPFLPYKLRHALGRFGGAVMGLIFVYFAFRLAIMAQDQFAAGTRTAGLGISYWWLASLGGLSCFASGLLAIFRRQG
nr:TRAP transporter small permease [uncultured Cohaesibacter sp.]